METIESVIKQRLKLQTTQRELSNSFNVNSPAIKYLTSAKFGSIFDGWDESKQNQFLVLVGGKTNFWDTKKYFNSQRLQNL